MTRMEKTLAKIDINRITDELDEKINEIFIKWQTALLIESGDVEPMEAIELEQLTAKTAAAMAVIITKQVRNNRTDE